MSLEPTDLEQTEAPAQEEGVLASLGLNGQLFVSQLVNFALVFIVVWFIILRPLVRKMEERRVQINDSLDKVKEVETNLAMSERKYQERIDEAKVEANKILEAATVESERTGDKMKVRAKQDIQLLIDQAKRNIQIERDEAIGAVKHEAVDLIFSVLQKVLPEKLTSENDKKVIEETLKELKK
ncbi:MAG: F0F1 ATP synthase subunit B [Patescibacteria group bacterium]